MNPDGDEKSELQINQYPKNGERQRESGGGGGWHTSRIRHNWKQGNSGRIDLRYRGYRKTGWERGVRWGLLAHTWQECDSLKLDDRLQSHTLFLLRIKKGEGHGGTDVTLEIWGERGLMNLGESAHHVPITEDDNKSSFASLSNV